MLLPVFLQFLSASPSRGRPLDADPEKGGAAGSVIAEPTSGSQDRSSHDRGDDEVDHTPDDDDDDDDEEHLTMDDEHDENEIIRDLETEENDRDNHSLHEPHRHHHLSTPFTHSTTLASTLSTSTLDVDPPKWFLKVKGFLNPSPAHKDLDSYIPNYRYTPIISGVLIPLSILLEIPGLTQNWYIRTEQNHTVETKPNPVILDVGLGISMACALAANICLVMRFLEKRVWAMTVACIVFLTIHDLINIIATTVFGVQHRFDDGFTYGQSFWMTVCSTIASTFTNLTLLVDLIRTPNFANSGSGLTRKQRSLVIIVIILMCYIALGALIQSFLLHLTFINALYFTVVSIETIGFGDITPDSTGSRVFTCFYSAFGILNLALAVGLTRETVLEGLEVGYRKRVKAVRERRKAARWRRRVEGRWREAVEWRLREAGKVTWVRDHDRDAHTHFLAFMDRVWPTGNSKHFTGGYGRGLSLGYGQHPHGMHLNLEALTEAQLEAAALEAGVPLETLLPPGFRRNGGEGRSISPGGRKRQGSESCVPVPVVSPGGGPNQPGIPQGNPENLPLTHVRLGRMVSMLGTFALSVHSSGRLAANSPVEVPMKREQSNISTGSRYARSLSQQYETFRSGMEKEERKAFYARLIVAWSLFIMFWMVGSAIFMATEGWSYGIAMYFCFIAFTTIGYGDISPETPAGRSVFVVWALLGVGTMTILISILSEAYSYRYKSAVHTGVFDRAVKRYRARTRASTEKPQPRQFRTATFSPDLNVNSVPSSPMVLEQNKESPLDKPSTQAALSQSQERVNAQLEALPQHILRQARTFNEHVQFFLSHKTNDGGDNAVPEGLRKLMDDIAGAERLGERIKEEILQDDSARHTLFTLSIERGLQKMIDVAQEAMDALSERDSLAALHEQLP